MRLSCKNIGTLSASLLTLSGFVACSTGDSLSCGTGTIQEENDCIVDPAGRGGEGGQGGRPSSSEQETSGDIETVVIVVDRDGRSTTQSKVEEEFKGAVAAGPVADTTIEVVWKPLPITGLSYNIYYAKDEDDLSFGVPQYSAPEGSNSFEVNGLDEGDTYYIAVTPVLEGVELEAGRNAVSVVPQNDKKPPSFVGVKSGKSRDGAAVELSWESATDDLSPSEVIRYYVYVGTDREFALEDSAVELRTPFAISTPGATSMLVSGLELPETEFFFLVRARDAAGNIEENIKSKSAVSGKDISAPSFAGCGNIPVVGASTATVAWDPAQDDLAPADDITYNFYVSTKPDGHNFSDPSFFVTGGTEATVPELEPETTYYIICRAQDSAGNEEENIRSTRFVTGNDDEPPTFAGLTNIANIEATSVDLVWAEAEDNQSAADEITYSIYLSLSPDAAEDPDALKYEVKGDLSISLEELSSNTAYYVQIVASDLAQQTSEPSSERSFTTAVSLLADLEIPIFSNKCATSGCHAGASPVAGLNLALGWSYNSSVGVSASTGLGSGKLIVDPGSPDTSHLVERIESTDLGSKMPQDPEVFLSQKEIDTVRAWIAQGAKDN